jgi:hypothetical protein
MPVLPGVAAVYLRCNGAGLTTGCAYLPAILALLLRSASVILIVRCNDKANKPAIALHGYFSRISNAIYAPLQGDA